MPRSISSRVVEFYFRISGRQRKFSDPKRLERHIEKNLEGNERYSFDVSKFRVPVTTMHFSGRECAIINPGKNKAVMYLHGGSCIHQMLRYHYRFLDRLSSAADATVYALIYPLAPKHTFEETYAMMSEVYGSMLNDFQPEHISIMGDSIGGGLALGFIEMLKGTDLPCPGSVVLLSPWLDMTDSVDRTEYYKNEPRLALNELKMCGDMWAGAVDKKDPRLSPLYGEIPHKCRISVYVGTREVLLSDSRRLKEIAEKSGIEIKYHEYEGMTHVFPLQPIKEAKEVFPSIVSDIV